MLLVRSQQQLVMKQKLPERLLELLIDASKDPCFGLHSAEFVEPASYGVLGYITMNCATLREVLAKIPIYEPIVGDMGISTAEFDRDHVTQHWHCQFTRPLSRRHEIENVLACWQRYAQNFLHFPELVDHPFSGLRIPKHLLDKPIPQADNQLLQTLLDHATKTLTSIHHNQPLFAQVKNLLRLSLKDHAPSSKLIANHLNISSRTLQRKLNDEGYQYKGLLNEVRLELALHYLQSTQLSLDNIAYELGYTEARSFHRGFKQWTGRTAGSFRN